MKTKCPTTLASNGSRRRLYGVKLKTVLRGRHPYRKIIVGACIKSNTMIRFRHLSGGRQVGGRLEAGGRL